MRQKIDNILLVTLMVVGIFAGAPGAGAKSRAPFPKRAARSAIHDVQLLDGRERKNPGDRTRHTYRKELRVFP